MQILIVEDEASLMESMVSYLGLEGFRCEQASDFRSGVDMLDKHDYLCMLIDLNLPDGDGLELVKLARENKSESGIIIISARNAIEERVAGLEAGADDYLVKPFVLEVLEARINTLLRRRNGTAAASCLSFGQLRLDLNSRLVSRNGSRITLKPALFTLLKLLMLRAPAVVTKDEIISALWGDDEPEGDVMRTHIYQLRALIDKPFSHAYIKTVPTVGYQLVREQ